MARRHVPVLLVRVLLVLAPVVAVAGCTTPSIPATHPVPDTGEAGSRHVHGVELNPSDGSLYAATHDGVFRLDAESPVRVSQHRQDTMSFAAVGPDHFLASGHPAVGEPGPAHLGLTASRDGGRTWSVTFTALAAQPPRKLALLDHVSYVGDSDRHSALIGVDAVGTVVSLVADGWQISGSLPGPPTAFTVIAPDRYAAATGSQVFVSEDAGRTWVLLARLDGS